VIVAARLAGAAPRAIPHLFGARMSRQNIKTFVKAGAVGASNVATELDRAFAAARGNTLKGVGDMIAPLCAIHKALTATHASGELTDEQFTEKGRELLEMLGNAVVSLFIQQAMRSAFTDATAARRDNVTASGVRRGCK
jgi:hypothetical protein